MNQLSNEPESNLSDLADLPADIAAQIAGAKIEPIALGMSRAAVYHLIWPDGVTRFLKLDSNDGESGVRAEVERLRWLNGRLPVPKVIAYGESEITQAALIEAVPGLDCSNDHILAQPDRLILRLAEGLRQIHALDPRSCPFDRRPDTVIAEAIRRAEAGLIDLDDLDDVRQGWTADALIAALKSTRPADQPTDLVVVHGDYCLPNILVTPDAERLTGVIDWGRAGVGDRYLDLALAVRSIIHNLDTGWVKPFLDAYGLPSPDHARIEFYQLLDEFF